MNATNLHVNNKTRKKINRKAIFEFVFEFLSIGKKIIFLVLIISMIVAGLTLSSIFVMQELVKLILNSSVNSSINESNINFYGGILLGVYLATILFSYGVNISLNIIIQKAGKKIMDVAFAKMLRLPIRYFDQIQSGDLMSRMTNDKEAMVGNMITVFAQIVVSFFVMISMFVAMFVVSTYLTLIALVLIILSFIGVILIVKKSQHIYKFRQIALGKLNAFIEEMISGQKEIILYSQEKRIQTQYDKLNREHTRYVYKANYYFSFIFPWTTFTSNLTIAIITTVGIIFAVNKTPSAGIYDSNLFNTNTIVKSNIDPRLVDLAFYGQYMIIINSFLLMVRNFNGPLNQLNVMMNSVQSFFSSANRFKEIFDQKEEFLLSEKYNMQIVDFDAKKFNKNTNQSYFNSNSQVELTEQMYNDYLNIKYSKNYTLEPTYQDHLLTKKVNTNITVNDLNFAYQENIPILKNINMKVKKGETIAIVGPTGSGKSTFINLLTKFYDIEKGEILFDKLSIKNITKKSMRKNVSVVLQDNFIFSESIKSNILYGKPDATDAEVIHASKIAEAHDFIMQLENSYDTVFASNDESLSHGQKQLISIARAILSPSELLILDEATSSVDTTTEKEIQVAMLRLMQNKTSFVIAHRLSTIKNASKILVLKDGQIIEAGNHQELLNLNGFYANLYYSQFSN